MPLEEKSHLSKAIFGASWLAVSKLVSQLFSWTFTILVTRILSSRDYGLMEMATVFTGYLAFFVEFGMGAALVNRTNVSKEENSSVFWILFFWGSILFLLAYLLGPVTADFYQEPELTKLTQFAGILFLLSSLILNSIDVMDVFEPFYFDFIITLSFIIMI
jgi:O-antigen/teichoic acid export membrane protein